MKTYAVYQQGFPIEISPKMEIDGVIIPPEYKANLRKRGEVKANNSSQALRLAKLLIAKPVIELLPTIIHQK